MRVKDIECKGADLIHVSKNRDQWRFLTSTVMNPPVR
jgi:hypothetical protein